jgi:hypothetical protein
MEIHKLRSPWKKKSLPSDPLNVRDEARVLGLLSAARVYGDDLIWPSKGPERDIEKIYSLSEPTEEEMLEHIKWETEQILAPGVWVAARWRGGTHAPILPLRAPTFELERIQKKNAPPIAVPGATFWVRTTEGTPLSNAS